MKDFPVFTTENGVASITLKEIPYRGEAYIQLQDSLNPEALLKECADFCTACGAERVYAAGAGLEDSYPLHVVIYEMRGTPGFDPDGVKHLWPVTAENAGEWRRIYNSRMQGVDHARTLESRDEAALAESRGTYFIHEDGTLLGIGWLEDTELKAIAGCRPGAGQAVLNTLISLNPAETLTLEVASTNEKAIALYEKSGFLKTGERVRWYRVK